MNLAFPALMIVALLSPGLVLVFRASKGWLDLSFEQRHLPKSLLLSMGAASVLHLLGGLICHWIGKPISYGTALALLLGKTTARLDAAIPVLCGSLVQTTVYLLSLCVLAYILGIALNFLLNHYRLDLLPRLSKIFHLSNDWVYYLSGDYPLLPGMEDEFGEAREPDMIRVSALVSVAGKAFLYCGVLKDFYFKPSGELDRLVLAYAMRRPFTEDRPEKQAHDPLGDGRYYRIVGDRFVIKYDEINTLNFQYHWFDLQDSTPDV